MTKVSGSSSERGRVEHTWKRPVNSNNLSRLELPRAQLTITWASPRPSNASRTGRTNGLPSYPHSVRASRERMLGNGLRTFSHSLRGVESDASDDLSAHGIEALPGPSAGQGSVQEHSSAQGGAQGSSRAGTHIFRTNNPQSHPHCAS